MRRGRQFAVGEHPSTGKKLARESLESMTLNLRATCLEGEFDVDNPATCPIPH
jgi:hypothetical protein